MVLNDRFCSFTTTNKLVNEAANDSARVSGQDRKKLPALGTNQIAGFEGSRPLVSLEKNKSIKLFTLKEENIMMNKNILLCTYLTLGFLLYDLYFDIAWLFSPHNHKIVYLVMAVLCVHNYCFCSDFNIFPRPFKPSMCPLHPFKAPFFLETQFPPSFELQSKTLHVVKMVVSSALSFHITHFKVSVIQNFNLSNFLVSLLALTTIIFTLTFMFCRKVLCMVSLRAANDQV